MQSIRPASRRRHRSHLAPTLARLAAAALGIGLLASCSGGGGEDVRITLCKDLVKVKLGHTPNWTQVRTQTPGYRDAVVNLAWSGPQAEGGARCSYRYNAVDDTAQQLADPLSAYATSPSQVVINGQTLSGSALARAVADAMKHQGKQLLDSAGKLLQQ
jgi:hypothetical protein